MSTTDPRHGTQRSGTMLSFREHRPRRSMAARSGASAGYRSPYVSHWVAADTATGPLARARGVRAVPAVGVGPRCGQ